jgi:glyoxylase I family protein
MMIDHIGISVSNMEQSIRFYGEMLGLEKLCEVFPFGGTDYDRIMAIPDVAGRMCMVGKDDFRLELFEFASPRPRIKDASYPVSDIGYSHFGVMVEDVDAAYARMRAAGVPIHSPVIGFMAGRMNALYARDPDGNVFELIEQRLPDADVKAPAAHQTG